MASFDDLPKDAHLSDAKAIPEQLKKAKSLEGATMPDKSINP